jgi:aspartate aminotransferase-like enzyme
MNKHNLVMVVGPTEMEKDILKAGSLPCEYMRTDDYTEKLRKIYEGLQYIFQTKNPVVMYASSGTGMLEAAVTNCLSKGDTALYVNGGSFGKRWGDILKLHGVNGIEEKVEFGKSVNPERIKQQLENHPEVKAVFTTLDETSSGALTDVKAIGSIVKQYPNTVLVVDCVSALVVEKMQMDDWNVDIAITSSQKALAIPPGLGFMAISEKGLAAAEKADLRLFYFDILEYVKDWKRHQTPFTPAVSLINQLELRLIKIQKEGLENLQNRYSSYTDQIRKGLESLGFKTFAEHPSNCVTGCSSGKYSAKKIIKIMREDFNIEIAPSGGDMADVFFRVGNFGAIGPKEIKKFLGAMKKTISLLDSQKE